MAGYGRLRFISVNTCVGCFYVARVVWERCHLLLATGGGRELLPTAWLFVLGYSILKGYMTTILLDHQTTALILKT